MEPSLVPSFKFPSRRNLANRALGLLQEIKLQQITTKPSSPFNISLETGLQPPQTVPKGLVLQQLDVPTVLPLAEPVYVQPSLGAGLEVVAQDNQNQHEVVKLCSANNALKRGNFAAAEHIIGRPLTAEENQSRTLTPQTRIDANGNPIVVSQYGPSGMPAGKSFVELQQKFQKMVIQFEELAKYMGIPQSTIDRTKVRFNMFIPNPSDSRKQFTPEAWQDVLDMVQMEIQNLNAKGKIEPGNISGSFTEHKIREQKSLADQIKPQESDAEMQPGLEEIAEKKEYARQSAENYRAARRESKEIEALQEEEMKYDLRQRDSELRKRKVNSSSDDLNEALAKRRAVSNHPLPVFQNAPIPLNPLTQQVKNEVARRKRRQASRSIEEVKASELDEEVKSDQSNVAARIAADAIDDAEVKEEMHGAVDMNAWNDQVVRNEGAIINAANSDNSIPGSNAQQFQDAGGQHIGQNGQLSLQALSQVYNQVPLPLANPVNIDDQQLHLVDEIKSSFTDAELQELNAVSSVGLNQGVPPYQRILQEIEGIHYLFNNAQSVAENPNNVKYYENRLKILHAARHKFARFDVAEVPQDLAPPQFAPYNHQPNVNNAAEGILWENAVAKRAREEIEEDEVVDKKHRKNPASYKRRNSENKEEDERYAKIQRAEDFIDELDISNTARRGPVDQPLYNNSGREIDYSNISFKKIDDHNRALTAALDQAIHHKSYYAKHPELPPPFDIPAKIKYLVEQIDKTNLVISDMYRQIAQGKKIGKGIGVHQRNKHDESFVNRKHRMVRNAQDPFNDGANEGFYRSGMPFSASLMRATGKDAVPISGQVQVSEQHQFTEAPVRQYVRHPEIVEDLKEELIPIAQNTGGKKAFGKYMLDHYKLKGSGILSLSHRSGRKIAGMPNRALTPEQQRALLGVVEGRGLPKKMSDETAELMHHLHKKAQLDATPLPSMHKKSAGNVNDHTRLETLLGEKDAGNDNEDLDKEIAALTSKMHGRGLITTSHMRDIIKAYL